MGYSEYGGVGFRDGKRIPSLSDVVLTPDLSNLGKPGCIPQSPDGMDDATFNALLPQSIKGHVVLGEGPVFVSLYKRDYFYIHVLEGGAFRDLDDFDLVAAGIDLPEDLIVTDEEGPDADRPKFDGWRLSDMDGHEGVVRFRVADHIVEVRMMRQRGYALHARLIQPDGIVWSGFCGSEIGAGWDEEDTKPHLDRHLTAFVD